MQTLILSHENLIYKNVLVIGLTVPFFIREQFLRISKIDLKTNMGKHCNACAN